MKKCALVIGHKKSSPGAVNESSGITEFEFNEKLAMDIEAAVDDVIIQRIYRRTYRTLPDDINVYTPDFIISMHCNAFNKSASGSEVLYYHKSSKGRAMAEILQANLVGALGLKDRGAKSRTVEDRGGNLLKYTNAPCVISEPFFIDNDNDFATAKERRKALVHAYAGAIESIAEIIRRDDMTAKAKLIIVGADNGGVFNDAKLIAGGSPLTREAIWVRNHGDANQWTGGDESVVVVPVSASGAVQTEHILRNGDNMDMIALRNAFAKAEAA